MVNKDYHKSTFYLLTSVRGEFVQGVLCPGFRPASSCHCVLTDESLGMLANTPPVAQTIPLYRLSENSLRSRCRRRRRGLWRLIATTLNWLKERAAQNWYWDWAELLQQPENLPAAWTTTDVLSHVHTVAEKWDCRSPVFIVRFVVF